MRNWVCTATEIQSHDQNSIPKLDNDIYEEAKMIGGRRGDADGGDAHAASFGRVAFSAGHFSCRTTQTNSCLGYIDR